MLKKGIPILGRPQLSKAIIICEIIISTITRSNIMLLLASDGGIKLLIQMEVLIVFRNDNIRFCMYDMLLHMKLVCGIFCNIQSHNYTIFCKIAYNFR